MTIVIIICIALIAITSIICYTIYRLSNNSKLEELYNEIKYLQKSVESNNEYFYKHWDEVLIYRTEIRELIDIVKSKEK